MDEAVELRKKLVKMMAKIAGAQQTAKDWKPKHVSTCNGGSQITSRLRVETGKNTFQTSDEVWKRFNLTRFDSPIGVFRTLFRYERVGITPVCWF